VPEPHFAAMVALHTAILAGCLLEAWLGARAPSAAFAASMVTAVVAANALRVWVIATLGQHWNVRIVDSLALGVVSDGPFRFVRHPNYVAVFVELLALPLVHGAWLTALLGAAGHVFVLYHRIRCEEHVLLRDPEYRARMGDKPRFIPGLL
jgi:methyltransferase